MTDQILLPTALRQYLEKELNIILSVLVTRDWESIQARSIENSGVDLVFLPSYWAQTLSQQGFLAPLNEPQDNDLFDSISSDFIPRSQKSDLSFLPLYWIKTGIQVSNSKTFSEFLSDSKLETLFLLADEDLILRHFRLWKSQGLWGLISKKKILTLQLDELTRGLQRSGAFERSLDQTYKGDDQGNLSALLIWGAAIPAGSTKKNVVEKLLKLLINPQLQSELLKTSPLNTTLLSVTDDATPFHRRALFIRDLRLKDSIILEGKNAEARQELRQEFNFIL